MGEARDVARTATGTGTFVSDGVRGWEEERKTEDWDGKVTRGWVSPLLQLGIIILGSRA